MTSEVTEQFVLAHLPAPPCRLLEVGCGSGELALELAAAGYDVVAIDPRSPNGEIFRRVALEAFVDPNPFDAAVANRSLHRIPTWPGQLPKPLLTYYVANLSAADRSKIIAMLDFDMVASPNFARQVYDGNGSEPGNPAGPNGSGFIESLFNTWFESQGQAHEPIPFDGRSDYVAFTNAGIPAGGIFTGAEKIKTAEEAALFGGVAGVALDHCYHQACDTINKLNTTAFGEMKNAAADVLYQLMLTRNAIEDGSTIKPGKSTNLANPAFVGEPQPVAAARTSRNDERPAMMAGRFVIQRGNHTFTRAGYACRFEVLIWAGPGRGSARSDVTPGLRDTGVHARRSST